jgi:hypothetical protein
VLKNQAAGFLASRLILLDAEIFKTAKSLAQKSGM